MQAFIHVGWETWTRTKTNGVRVRCSTIKLFPNECTNYIPLSGGIGKCFFSFFYSISELMPSMMNWADRADSTMPKILEMTVLTVSPTILDSHAAMRNRP